MQCHKCLSTAENWMCLSCHAVLCGRYVMEHMLYHNLETTHPLALSFSDLSVWCYPCESYVDNIKLHPYKNLAHRHKFGEDMQWAYDGDDDDETVGDQQRKYKNYGNDSNSDDDEDNSNRDQQENKYSIHMSYNSNN